MSAENCSIVRRPHLLWCALGSSLALHGVAYASLGSVPVHSTASPASTVTIEVAPAPTRPKAPPPEPPTPATAAPAPQARNVVPTLHAERAAAPPTPPPLPAPSSAPAPVDLSGVTLSNDTGSGFAMPLGNGAPLGPPAPIGQARATGLPSPALAKPEAQGPRVVAAKDLSEHPRPPALGALLQQNYPEAARRRGISGSARVRARIDADGLIRDARLLSESDAGFGQACRRTVTGSHWSPPRAQNGDAVATEIVYTCHFEVAP